jgi:TetR/AcrR family fatty acid metabolism transcriptional regulator
VAARGGERGERGEGERARAKPERPPRPERRASSREDKRRRIIDAAVEVFADKGFFSAKVSEIAEAAGVADGTIYLYFESKDDLLISLFREKMAEILHRLGTIVGEHDDPEAKLRRYILEHLNLVAEQPKLMQVLTVELRQSSLFMKEHSHRSFARYLALLAGIIDDGQKRGAFKRHLRPNVMVRAIFGAIDEISLSWVLSGTEEAPPAERTEVAAEICELVLSGLRSVGPG